MTDRKKTKKVSKARIYRAVASSSAIETNEPIEVIELKLKNRKSEFRGVRLQLAL
jgi:hypothetical protein